MESRIRLATALRETAERLSAGARYEWGHMGRCNCGHLVQTITGMSDRDIVASVDNQLDEWTEHARACCGSTGSAAEVIFQALLEIGFSHDDMIHLEHLSDEHVLTRIDRAARPLRKNRATDVAIYMKAMADMIAAPVSPLPASPLNPLLGEEGKNECVDPLLAPPLNPLLGEEGKNECVDPFLGEERRDGCVDLLLGEEGNDR